MRCTYFALTILVALCSTARAGLVDLSTDDAKLNPASANQGWWSSDRTGNTDVANIHTGQQGGSQLRSFYTFDLSALSATDTINSATLIIERGIVAPATGTATISFASVSTAAATLNDTSQDSMAIGDAIYADLGGNDFGTGSIDLSGASSPISFALSAAAVAAIQADAGGAYFSIGGSLSPGQTVFAGVTTPVILQLDVTAVPEPSSLMVLGGLGCVACLRRRRS